MVKDKLVRFFSEHDYHLSGKILDDLVALIYNERENAYQAGYDDARFFVADDIE